MLGNGFGDYFKKRSMSVGYGRSLEISDGLRFQAGLGNQLFKEATTWARF
jgi:hypothetical protein